MARQEWKRRTAIGAGLATLGTLFAGRTAGAQLGDPLKALGQLGIPPELADLLPKRERDLARTIAALVELERDANARGLAASPLAFGGSAASIAPTAASLYLEALPRLVAVIDRSEETDVAISDRAGSVLADLHARLRVIPDGLQPDKLVPSRRRDFASLKDEYRQLFAAATLRDEFATYADWHLKAMTKFRDRYEKVATATGVPWYFIGAIHGLESSFNFRAHLHNGDFPLSSRTRQVPANKPVVWLPPSDWEASARDALKLMGFAGQRDWSLERTLYRLEAFNGFGYRRFDTPTPYLWCFTNHYDRGKFVSDGTWDAKARSQQCGSATILKLLANAGLVTFPAE
jgi:lysozyme family protein